MLDAGFCDRDNDRPSSVQTGALQRLDADDQRVGNLDGADEAVKRPGRKAEDIDRLDRDFGGDLLLGDRVDLAPAMIDRARAVERSIAVDWRVGDPSDPTRDDAPYDAIHCQLTLQFVLDPAATLAAFGECLRPEGRLYVSVPGVLSPIYRAAWRRRLDRERLPVVNGPLPWEHERLPGATR